MSFFNGSAEVKRLEIPTFNSAAYHSNQNSPSRDSIHSITVPLSDDHSDAIQHTNLCPIPSGHGSPKRVGGVICYISPSTNEWRMLALIYRAQLRSSNVVCIIEYNPMLDSWRPIDHIDAQNEEFEDPSSPTSSEYDIFLPLRTEHIAVNAANDTLHLLAQSFAFSLSTRQWRFEAVLPAQWQTEGCSSTMYISEGVTPALHGVFHHRKDYGQRHVYVTGEDKDAVAQSDSVHIDAQKRLQNVQLLYCAWFRRLMVFGGQCIPRKKRRSKSRDNTNSPKRKSKCFRKPKDTSNWSDNLNVYYCDIGSKDLSSTKPRWRKSKQSLGSLPHSQMKAVVVCEHIAIVFLFYGAEEFIGVYCWDLTTKKKYKCAKYIDFESDSIDDLHIVKSGELALHLFDLQRHTHARIQVLDIIPMKLIVRCGRRYSCLVRGFIGRENAAMVEAHVVQERIGAYCFTLCALSSD